MGRMKEDVKIVEKLGLSQQQIRALSMKRIGAIQRCYRAKSKIHKKNYQDKGITVCKEWLDWPCGHINFLSWAAGKYQDDLELDRIDNSKGYSPENCRFVSKRDNLRNRSNCLSARKAEAVRILFLNGFSKNELKKILKLMKTELDFLEQT